MTTRARADVFSSYLTFRPREGSSAAYSAAVAALHFYRSPRLAWMDNAAAVIEVQIRTNLFVVIMLIFLFQCRSGNKREIRNISIHSKVPNLLWYSFVFCRILCRNVCLRPSGLMKQSEEQIQCQSHVTYAIPPLSSNQVCCTHHNFPVSPDYWVEEKLNRWDHPVSFHVCATEKKWERWRTFEVLMNFLGFHISYINRSLSSRIEFLLSRSAMIKQ